MDWDDLAVRPGDFHDAGRIGAKLPWLKTALITTQYLPAEGQKEKGPHGKHFGNVISKDQWKRLAKAAEHPGSPLRQVEEFLSYLAGMYLKCEELDGGKVAVEIPAAFVRTVKCVLLAKDLDKDAIDIGKVEGKLRLALAPATLPPPFVASAEEAKGETPKKSKAATPVQPDTLPALTFEGGNVIEDTSVLARAKNLALGCRVCAVRMVRGVRKGGQGTLLAMAKEAKVAWGRRRPGRCQG